MTKMLLVVAAVLASSAALAQSPYIVAPNGQYLGNLNRNQFDPNSVSNSYGRYGNRYSSDSINNPYGQYGNPYSPNSVTNPYAIGSQTPQIFCCD